MDTLETRSRDVQERTFCKWLNTKLEMHNYPPMTSLVKDLSDGVRLIQLMEIMGDVSLGRYNKNPRIRVQKAENVTMALDFIASRGVKLTNIGPEDIIDGNLKLILGMIWTLILRFTIADIKYAGLSSLSDASVYLLLVKRVFLQKKVSFCGVSAKHILTMKLMCKTFLIVGAMV